MPGSPGLKNPGSIYAYSPRKSVARYVCMLKHERHLFVAFRTRTLQKSIEDSGDQPIGIFVTAFTAATTLNPHRNVMIPFQGLH